MNVPKRDRHRRSSIIEYELESDPRSFLCFLVAGIELRINVRSSITATLFIAERRAVTSPDPVKPTGVCLGAPSALLGISQYETKETSRTSEIINKRRFTITPIKLLW